MRKSLQVFAIIAVALLTLGFFRLAPHSSTSLESQLTINTDDISRAVDIRSLPVNEVKEPF